MQRPTRTSQVHCCHSAEAPYRTHGARGKIAHFRVVTVDTKKHFALAGVNASTFGTPMCNKACVLVTVATMDLKAIVAETTAEVVVEAHRAQNTPNLMRATNQRQHFSMRRSTPFALPSFLTMR